MSPATAPASMNTVPSDITTDLLPALKGEAFRRGVLKNTEEQKEQNIEPEPEEDKPYEEHYPSRLHRGRKGIKKQ
ncbi:hypothetical protein APY94_03115 [Thermococcus celericrescens]|uniref:Uncharacterized protein n=1 Tax=Thermococcus celericrescens TaxID=227598 RepID=A0A100XZ52_9EURY|nr:hypothetical protein [Thermococcus celericrescens]KUH34276.1 hypothetical protein APY94_03115 [Thermococcus celericrescens]